MIGLQHSPAVAARARERRRTWLFATVGGLLYLAIALAAISMLQDGFGGFHPLPVAVLALAPVAVVLALRMPLIFPFGLYVVLLPYDTVLQLSSGATITRLVAIATVATLLARIVITRDYRKPGRAWYALFAFTLFTAISFLWSSGENDAVGVLAQSLQLFAVTTVLAIYPARPRELAGAFACCVASGVGAALYAAHLYQSGSVTVAEHRLVLAASNGVAIDPNYFATFFVIPMAVAFAGAFNLKSMLARIGCYCSIFIMMTGILVSGSRGGFVAIGIVFLYFIIRSKHRIMATSVAVATLSLTALIPTVYNRFLHDPSGTNGSGSGRTFIWHTGLVGIERHWLFGAGIGSFENVYDRALLVAHQVDFQGWHRPSHSMLVGTLVEYGVVGLVLLGTMWWSLFRATRRIGPESKLSWMRLTSEATIVGLASQAFFLDVTAIKYYWLAYAIPLMVANVASRYPDGSREGRTR